MGAQAQEHETSLLALEHFNNMAPNQHVGSYYAATANPSPEREILKGAVSADVCVIGAGYAGLSTALHLAELGYSVVVLEAAKVGWGASGRNGGQIVNGYSRDLETIERRYGKDAAKALGAMSLEAWRHHPEPHRDLQNRLRLQGDQPFHCFYEQAGSRA